MLSSASTVLISNRLIVPMVCAIPHTSLPTWMPSSIMTKRRVSSKIPPHWNLARISQIFAPSKNTSCKHSCTFLAPKAPQAAQHHPEIPTLVLRLPPQLINCWPIKQPLCPRWLQRLHKWLHWLSYLPRPRTSVPMLRANSSMSRPSNRLLSRCSSHFQPQGHTPQDKEVSVEVAVATKVDAKAVAAIRNGFMPHIMGHKLSHIYAREVRWNFKFDSWYSSKICSCLSKKFRHSLHLLFLIMSTLKGDVRVKIFHFTNFIFRPYVKKGEYPIEFVCGNVKF